MRKSILILIVSGAFFAGTILTPQIASADHNDQLFFDSFTNLINVMIALSAGIDAIIAAVGGIFATLLDQSCPADQVMIGIDPTGAAICAETGVIVDPITGDICIGDAAACAP